MAISIRIVNATKDIDAATWDSLANPTGHEFNPLVSHAFFNACEMSGSATPQTGWSPHHLVMQDGDKTIGIAPCYLKSHSMGEYVFDHAFADAFHRAGGRYYPKLQCSVPFSPVTGPRLFAASAEHRLCLVEGLLELNSNSKTSSLHLTFVPQQTVSEMAEQDFLSRNDIQFHWHNAGYKSFDDFLNSLSSSKRTRSFGG